MVQKKHDRETQDEKKKRFLLLNSCYGSQLTIFERKYFSLQNFLFLTNCQYTDNAKTGPQQSLEHEISTLIF